MGNLRSVLGGGLTHCVRPPPDKDFLRADFKQIDRYYRSDLTGLAQKTFPPDVYIELWSYVRDRDRAANMLNNVATACFVCDQDMLIMRSHNQNTP